MGQHFTRLAVETFFPATVTVPHLCVLCRPLEEGSELLNEAPLTRFSLPRFTHHH